MKCRVTCTCLYTVSHTHFSGDNHIISYILQPYGIILKKNPQKGGGYIIFFFLQYVHILSSMNKNELVHQSLQKRRIPDSPYCNNSDYIININVGKKLKGGRACLDFCPHFELFSRKRGGGGFFSLLFLEQPGKQQIFRTTERG